MDCPDFGVCNPSVIQPNVRRQATFLNRDTESVVALTPNTELVVGRLSLVVGISALLLAVPPSFNHHKTRDGHDHPSNANPPVPSKADGK